MAFEISTGRVARAQKICIYGVEGVGKSTFASCFPNPLFIDTEGSTGNMDVRRLPKPTSWTMLGEEMNAVLSDHLCDTLVIDTVDWAEQLCIDHILAKYDKNGIEDFGYGNGYVYEKEEFGRFLNKTEALIAAGINVVLTAHAQLRKFSQPDEIGEYDRYELKLGKKTGSSISPLVKEWADLLLFANYKTMAVAVDKEGKKFKAQGNARVMYTEHHPCWDAKNRHGLAAELPFEYASIAPIFERKSCAEPEPVSAGVTRYFSDGKRGYKTNGEKPVAEAGTEIFEITEADYEKLERIRAELAHEDTAASISPTPGAPENKETAPGIPGGIPRELSDLMQTNGVTEAEIRKVVSLKGYFPENTPLSNYPDDFVRGVLVAAWDQVYAMIKDQREMEQMPF